SWSSVITTCWSWIDMSSRTVLKRSWVIGRGVSMPCRAYTMAVASGGPMKIGRYRCPSSSRSSTIGWFVGTSTRTPTSDRRITSCLRRSGETSTYHPPSGTARPRTPGAVEHVDVRRRPVENQAPVGLDDVRDISIQVDVVEPVAEHEHVLDLLAHVAGGEGDDAPNGPVQERAHIERTRRPLSHVRQQVREGEPGVHQVLDQDDVPTFDVDVEVLEDPDASRVGGVAGDRQEVDGHLDVRDGAGQVGEEHERPFQDADQHDAVGMIGGDPARDAVDACRDRPPVEENGRRRLALGLGRARHSAIESRTAWTSNAERKARPSLERVASSSRALARASGFRCRRYWSATCWNSVASRSAKCLYMRRCRAPMPCA